VCKSQIKTKHILEIYSQLSLVLKTPPPMSHYSTIY
jgi:hypothetical protein